MDFILRYHHILDGIANQSGKKERQPGIDMNYLGPAVYLAGDEPDKLVRLEQLKISQAKLRISKVQEGWENGFYSPEEVHTKLAEHREAIAKAESEIERLHQQMAKRSLSAIEAELLRHKLKTLRDRNLQESVFEEKADLVAKLGIKVLPSEDLKSRKIFCRLNLTEINKERERAGFAKMTFGGPKMIFPHRTASPPSLVLSSQVKLIRHLKITT